MLSLLCFCSVSHLVFHIASSLSPFHFIWQEQYFCEGRNSQHSQSHQSPNTNLLRNTEPLRPKNLPHHHNQRKIHSRRERLRAKLHDVLHIDAPARAIAAAPARGDWPAPQPVRDGRAGEDHIDENDHRVQRGADQARRLQAEQSAGEGGLAPRHRRQGQAAGDVVQQQERRGPIRWGRGLAAACSQGQL